MPYPLRMYTQNDPFATKLAVGAHQGKQKDLSLDLRPRGISQSKCKGSTRMA